MHANYSAKVIENVRKLITFAIRIKQSGLAYYPVQRVAYAPKEQ